MSKLFTKDGARLHMFVGSGEHKWELRDNSGTVYFAGNADEVDKHIDNQTKSGEYSDVPKRGRRKK